MPSPAKLRVAILFGGKSVEHEVSLQSGKNVIDALDRTRFEPVLIGIDKQGGWHLHDAGRFLINGGNPRLIALNRSTRTLTLTPGAAQGQLQAAGPDPLGPIDVVFPVLHGSFGEDGSVQGLLKLAGLPFVGPGVLGSAMGMDKDVTKRLLREAGIPTPRHLAFVARERPSIDFGAVAGALGLPLFVKPANGGSSVGIARAADSAAFGRAVDDAFRYDRKIMIEEAIEGREIECAVLGNDDPDASVPGEVIAKAGRHGFYSYEAKYIDENGAVLKVPAELTQQKADEVRATALRAFKVLSCEGMARVDFFLRPTGELLVNEINTIPGFTAISMYPRLWEASGIAYPELISRLIDLAIERHGKELALRTSIG